MLGDALRASAKAVAEQSGESTGLSGSSRRDANRIEAAQRCQKDGDDQRTLNAKKTRLVSVKTARQAGRGNPETAQSSDPQDPRPH